MRLFFSIQQNIGRKHVVRVLKTVYKLLVVNLLHCHQHFGHHIGDRHRVVKHYSLGALVARAGVKVHY